MRAELRRRGLRADGAHAAAMPKVWHLLSALLAPFAVLAAMAPQDRARLQGRVVDAEGHPVEVLPEAQVELQLEFTPP